jgi:hypothetical protein
MKPAGKINILVFFIYLCFSIIYFGFPMLKNINSNFIGTPPDPLLFIWCLGWYPYAIVHHLNPFLTNKFIWEPFGFNISWVNSIFGLSLLGAPLTLFFGPFVSYNILALLSSALSSFCAFLLIRHIAKSNLSGLIGGYIFGFSTYALSEQITDINLYFICIIPLIVLFYLKGLNGELNKKLSVFLISVLLSLEFLISSEIYATFIFFGFIGIFVSFIFFKSLRKDIKAFFYYNILSVFLSFIILIPFFYAMLATINKLPKHFMPPKIYSTDILNFIIPTHVTLIGGSIFKTIFDKFNPTWTQACAYIGLPLIILIVLYAKKHWAKQETKFLIFLLALISIFSLGQYLHIGGTITNIPLPWIIFYKMPLIGKALPSRFMLYAFLIISIIAGLFVKDIKNIKLIDVKTNFNFNLAINYSLIFLSILFLVPNQSRWQGHTYMPDFFANGLYKNYIKRGQNVLILPFSNAGYSMAFQSYDDFYYNLAGGYLFLPPEQYKNNLIFDIFYYGKKVKINKTVKLSLKKFIQLTKLNAIIVINNKNAATTVVNSRKYNAYRRFKKLLSVLKIKPVKSGGVYVYIIKNYDILNLKYN